MNVLPALSSRSLISNSRNNANTLVTLPAVAVTGFGGLAIWLAAHAALRAAGGGGPGSLLSGAIACAAVAAW